MSKPRFETSYVPFQLTSMAGASALVLAPHADDETLGCGGTLAQHRRYGDAVRIVVLTDGALAQQGTNAKERADYVATRREEARKAASILGVEKIDFWDEPDRGLAFSEPLVARLAKIIAEDRPGIVYAPSLHEFHPDHRICARLAWAAVARAEHPCRLAFYEVSRPFKVNTLVDISDDVETKIKASEAYESQNENYPYGELSLALNRHRALTVAGLASHVEAFDVIDSNIVADRSIDGWLLDQFLDERRSEAGEQFPPVSIVVRTKNRPHQLEEALLSIEAQSYPNIQVVVVNDGGVPVDDLVDRFSGRLPVKHIVNWWSRGRARAANLGFEACEGRYVGLLDDDDLLYPNHVEKLVAALEKKGRQVAFSEADVRLYRTAGDRYVPVGQKRLFANQPYSRELLLNDNYIPLMSAMFDRSCLEKTGGFDETLDQFEDWDFWIRLSEHYDFLKVDGASCEYRLLVERLQFPQRIRTIDARQAVYRKHAKYWSQERIVRYAWTQIHALEAELQAFKPFASVDTERMKTGGLWRRFAKLTGGRRRY